MPRFRSRNSEGGVVVHSVGLSPITVERGEVFESDDKAVVTALRGVPEVEEIKAKAAPKTKGDKDDE